MFPHQFYFQQNLNGIRIKITKPYSHMMQEPTKSVALSSEGVW